MRFLFLFMDGIGFGESNPETNPFAAAKMPTLEQLLGGKRLVRGSAPLRRQNAPTRGSSYSADAEHGTSKIETERATLLSLDAGLGMDGLPQSATGQAALLTGKNVSQMIGEHYGPKPTPQIAEIIRADNLFLQLKKRGYTAALLNAYPQRYFDAIASGRRLLSAIPLAVTSAGFALKTAEDYYAGEAFSVDFTGQGWRQQLGYVDAPLMTPEEAGRQLAALTSKYDLAFFEFWPSDYAGHHQDREGAIEMLENIDTVLAGLLQEWDMEQGLILITSDHGNMEDMTTRHHTTNPVPGLVIGSREPRKQFCAELKDISQITPAILDLYPPRG